MNQHDANDRKEKLRRDLLDKAYREQYATSTLIENVSAQVQALRRQRGLTQGDLATMIGTKQPRISYIEVPPEADNPPNWEVDTLDRIAHALGTRLKISFETYGSLVEELDALTSDSLRRVDFENDPVLFPRPEMPGADPSAPERTRWMQELMIPWLWEDKLGIASLIGWLQGRGLPPVGHDEEPYQWILRGISVQKPARDFLEKRFAERLAVVLGEQPDVEPIVPDRHEDFLINLYWTCAGLRRPSFLAEQLWQTYKRLKQTKPSGAVRDALQGALVHNQFGDKKPLKEIWEPMVEKGRHRLLRGNEIVGYEGILLRHQTIKPDLERVLWALGCISHRWESAHQPEFKRLIWKVPDLDRYEVARKLIDSARAPHHGWSPWALQLLPMVKHDQSEDGSLEISVSFNGTEFYAAWPAGGSARTSIRDTGSTLERHSEALQLSGPPRKLLLLNELLTRLGNSAEASQTERQIAHALAFRHLVRFRSMTEFPIQVDQRVRAPGVRGQTKPTVTHLPPPNTLFEQEPNGDIEAALVAASIVSSFELAA